MKREGPPLATLLRRIVDTPPDFLAEPKVSAQGVVHVDAVVGDVAALLGEPVPRVALRSFVTTRAADRNRLAIALLCAWVCADGWPRTAGVKPAELLRALNEVAADLAPHMPFSSCHADPDRREELVRTLFARLNLRPEGESEAQARDRLVSVSAAERKRMVDAARGVAARARAVREALARKAAEESADKMWRE